MNLGGSGMQPRRFWYITSEVLVYNLGGSGMQPRRFRYATSEVNKIPGYLSRMPGFFNLGGWLNEPPRFMEPLCLKNADKNLVSKKRYPV